MKAWTRNNHSLLERHNFAPFENLTPMSNHSSRQHSPRHNGMDPNFQNLEFEQQQFPPQEFENFQPPQQIPQLPRSLRELCYPTRRVHPSVILYPPIEGNNFELKSSFIQGIPKFTGSENAYEFLDDFQFYTSTLKMQQLSDDYIKLQLIPFALQARAKRWFNSLPRNSIRNLSKSSSPF